MNVEPDQVTVAGFDWIIDGPRRVLSCDRCDQRWTLVNGYGFARLTAYALAAAHERRHHPRPKAGRR